jgi:hypothetical protein
MFHRSHIQMQVENIPKGTNRRRKAEMREENKKRSPPTQLTWTEYRQGQGLGPSRNRLGEGSREASPPRYGRTPTASARPHSSATVACRHAMAVLGGFQKYQR